MNGFYIKNLLITGAGMLDATLNFTPGLNIVCGPSNTGKSYILDCIDFLFGSKALRLSEDTGYDTVRMLVEAGSGGLVLERKATTNKINVASTIANIESGDYLAWPTKTSAGISEVWLKLMGIDEEHQIIKNENYKKQRLTLRTFSHAFLINEEAIIQERSVLFGSQSTSITATLSALIFLLTGNDFSRIHEQDSKAIKEAKKKAIVGYINDTLSGFQLRLAALPHPAEGDDLYNQVEAIVGEIAATEKEITEAISASKGLLDKTCSLSEQLAESQTLLERYQALHTQYISDLKRLGFILDGEETERHYHTNTSKCPFCDSDIQGHEPELFNEATDAEIEKILLHLRDLGNVIDVLTAERETLAEELEDIQGQRADIKALIANDLQPKVNILKTNLGQYRIAIAQQSEMAAIDGLAADLQRDIETVQLDDSEDEKYKPRRHFDQEFITGIGGYLRRILEACKYEDFVTAVFDMADCDVTVNGKPKKAQGKGYRAFLNTILALAFLESLTDCGEYSPGLLILDSPILSLVEPGDAKAQDRLFSTDSINGEKASDTMKAGLFEYLVACKDKGQIIVVENEIPCIDYKDTNIINFTKVVGDGRYGLLPGVR